jgi:hypothetical protein
MSFKGPGGGDQIADAALKRCYRLKLALTLAATPMVQAQKSDAGRIQRFRQSDLFGGIAIAEKTMRTDYHGRIGRRGAMQDAGDAQSVTSE